MNKPVILYAPNYKFTPVQDIIATGSYVVCSQIQEQFWLLVSESKRSSFSLLEAVPQALVYMLANPNQDKPTFGLVTNGSDFIFLKLAKGNQPKYAISDQFTLLKRESELYQVLSGLKNLSQTLK
ncbi:hypothetical protein [Nostoc sp. FACHB-892]